ncbi:NAD(P)H-hydrate epimerase / ADP-dependent (S)-NAD(P)H-hydrate dehydratase [hydrothermal vent metagenome]|uniref:Nicotinamide nucleotide repair protein n=1 Tax=hydrothermal vent metagenome TaxID=652676 RepID=A0A3B0Y4A1_9ZZZZ
MLLYTAAQVRELDRRAIEDAGIDGYELMCRAGSALLQQVKRDWPDAGKVVLLCGPGNNGGDGYVLGRLLYESEYDVQLLTLVDPDRLQGAARQAVADFREAGGRIDAYAGELPIEADLLVDAMLGTGLDRPVEGLFAQAIERLNAHPAAVLAADIPSGLHADTGAAPGAAVKADVSVTFIGRKRGLYTAAGVEFAGKRVFASLGIPLSVFDGVRAESHLLQMPSPVLPPRARGAHKGDFGHLLLVGGGPGMPGAVRLAAEAAARSGAGLVSVATHPQHAAGLNSGRPELMVRAVECAADLMPLLAPATVVVVGPGLGRSHWGRDLLEAVLESRLPLVVDADALNLLANDPLHKDNWILTPHPGEAARLLGRSIQALQQDRFTAVKDLQAKYGGVVVLKGAGTLVAGETQSMGLCPLGNPGMASGGMGDVLSGVVGALLAQGVPAEHAAGLAVCMHAQAADLLAEKYGERGLLASDLSTEIRRLINGC